MWDWLQVEMNFVWRKVGRLFRRKNLNFIALHYIYMISWTIAGSILLFPAGGMAYIDALFFAAGASTQSGLNTVDVNTISTQQQVILYFIPMFTNPIVINGAVVFVRLYWFEKRFQHVVHESQSLRQSKTRSFNRKHEVEEKARDVEGGIRGKSIVLMDDGRAMRSPDLSPFKHRPESVDETAFDAALQASKDGNDVTSSESGSSQVPPANTDRSKPDITFIDQARRSSADEAGERLPEHRSTDHHIAFLERQRNPEDNDMLRIPGPRESDRGKLPERVRHADIKSGTNDGLPRRTSSDLAAHQRETPIRRNITIDDSARPTTGVSGRSHYTRELSRRNFTSNSNAITETDDPISPTKQPRRANTFSTFIRSTSTQNDAGPVPYLSWQPTVGRNSAFIDLTEAQREELGGIEYRSLKTLAGVVLSYFLFWHFLGIICFLPWILRTDEWGSIVDSDGQNRSWWAIFSTATLFNDVGFTLTPDSFISFNLAVLPLLLGSVLIVVGNTGFPCMLRLWIWIFQKFVPKSSAVWEELRFLLDHPRRCFTLLFPSAATWVLFAILVLMNGIDLIFFIILDINDPAVDVLPPGFRVLNGLFQATSTRTAGTAVVNLAELHPGIQVSYLIMMYISVFPIAISMRRTNVYEESSLGVYNSPEEEEADTKEPSYIGAHLRNQLSFDLWFIFLGLFIIAIAEGTRIADTSEPAFDLFACLFEVVSAYGTVGLSLGYPGINASFSAEFTVVSKLVVIAMMIRGRHRGLPYQLDRAILLPSEKLNAKEAEDAARRTRRPSATSHVPPASAVFVTGIDADEDGNVESRTRRSSGHHRHPVRDGIAKLPEGLAHVHSATKAELREHGVRP